MEEISQIGLAKVRTSNPSFEADVVGEAALAGAATNQIIGFAEPAQREKVDDVEALIDAEGTTGPRTSPRSMPSRSPACSGTWR